MEFQDRMQITAPFHPPNGSLLRVFSIKIQGWCCGNPRKHCASLYCLCFDTLNEEDWIVILDTGDFNPVECVARKVPALSSRETRRPFMSARRVRALIVMVVVLGVLGGGLLYATGRGALLGTVGGGIVGVIVVVGLMWAIVTGVAQGNWQFLEMFNPLDCCSFLGILGVSSVVTIGGILLWHSLLVAALAGGSIMTMLLLVVSVYAASYKAGSQSS